jgi:hypothetical protein
MDEATPLMKRAKPKLQVKQSAPSASRRPLLVIDGDSFAHRAYHALPKNILRDGDRPAGAILGFANRLLQLYRAERPRAVLVGWDTLEAATYRHEAFADYQSGREFDDDLIEQLALIPKFVAACGFANAKRAGYEADDFLAAAAAAEERRGGTVLVASGDRDAFQLASARTTILYPVRERYGIEPKQVPDFIALARRSVRQTAGRPGCRRVRRGDAVAPPRQPHCGPQGRAICALAGEASVRRDDAINGSTNNRVRRARRSAGASILGIANPFTAYATLPYGTVSAKKPYDARWSSRDGGDL